jgi:hypothetical protein
MKKKISAKEYNKILNQMFSYGIIPKQIKRDDLLVCETEVFLYVNDTKHIVVPKGEKLLVLSDYLTFKKKKNAPQTGGFELLGRNSKGYFIMVHKYCRGKIQLFSKV